MINELSILIPSYNSYCLPTVKRLHQLCERIAHDSPDGFLYEIIVADDASTEQMSVEKNKAINDIAHCQFLQKTTNTGSAATRNYLAEHSKYQWLLFIDSDMEIPGMDYIMRYLPYDCYDVVNGGIAVGGNTNSSNLRYLYEKHAEPMHTIDKANTHPYKEFRSTNFVISRHCFNRCHFDERFTKSGYEDVHFGMKLCTIQASIIYINNPLIMNAYETNSEYIAKCERNLRTLYLFRDELHAYSPLITLVRRIPHWPVRLWHRLFGRLERRHLMGSHPTLFIFQLYRVGYFVSLF